MNPQRLLGVDLLQSGGVVLSVSSHLALNVEVVPLHRQVDAFALGLDVVQQSDEPVVALVEDLLGVDVLHVLDEELDVFDLLDDVLSLRLSGQLGLVLDQLAAVAAQKQEDVETDIAFFDHLIEKKDQIHSPDYQEENVCNNDGEEKCSFGSAPSDHHKVTEGKGVGVCTYLHLPQR